MSWFLLLFFFVSCSLSASLSVCCLSACLCLFLVFLILSGPTTPVVSPLRSRLPTNYLAHWGNTDLLHLEDVFLVYGLDNFGFFCLILVLVLVLFLLSSVFSSCILLVILFSVLLVVRLMLLGHLGSSWSRRGVGESVFLRKYALPPA